MPRSSSMLLPVLLQMLVLVGQLSTSVQAACFANTNGVIKPANGKCPFGMTQLAYKDEDHCDRTSFHYCFRANRPLSGNFRMYYLALNTTHNITYNSAYLQCHGHLPGTDLLATVTGAVLRQFRSDLLTLPWIPKTGVTFWVRDEAGKHHYVYDPITDSTRKVSPYSHAYVACVKDAPKTFRCPHHTRYELFRVSHPSHDIRTSFEGAKQICHQYSGFLPTFHLRSCVAHASRTLMHPMEGSWLSENATGGAAFVMTRKSNGTPLLSTFLMTNKYFFLCARKRMCQDELENGHVAADGSVHCNVGFQHRATTLGAPYCYHRHGVCSPSCAEGYTYNVLYNRCLKFHTEPTFFYTAVDICKGEFARVLTISNRQQDTEVGLLAPDRDLHLSIVSPVNGFRRHHYTGVKVTYTNWPTQRNTNFPPTYYRTCTYKRSAYGKYHGTWWSASCTSELSFFCEQRPNELKCPHREYLMMAVPFRASNRTNYRIRQRVCRSYGADLPTNQFSRQCVSHVQPLMDPFTTTFKGNKEIYPSNSNGYLPLLCERRLVGMGNLSNEYQNPTRSQFICPSSLIKLVDLQLPGAWRATWAQARELCRDHLYGDLPDDLARPCVTKALGHFMMATTMSSVTGHGNAKQWTRAGGHQWTAMSNPRPFICQVSMTKNERDVDFPTVHTCGNYELYRPYGLPSYGDNLEKHTIVCGATGGVPYDLDHDWSCLRPLPTEYMLCVRQKESSQVICPNQKHKLLIVWATPPWWHSPSLGYTCKWLADGQPASLYPIDSKCYNVAPAGGYKCARVATEDDIFFSGTDYVMPDADEKPIKEYKPAAGRTCSNTGGEQKNGICSRRDVECDVADSGYCFKFYSQGKTWQRARDTCRAWSGDLARVFSREQAIALGKVANKHNRNRFWIGLNSRFRSHRPVHHQDTWQWTVNVPLSDGTSITSTEYTSWETGQPNAFSGEYCVMSIRSLPYGGLWHDYPCSTHAAFVCMRDRFL